MVAQPKSRKIFFPAAYWGDRMNFELSDEQRQLRDSLRRYLTDRYDFPARRTVLESETGWSRTVWRGLAELGVTGLGFDEDDGGLGGNAVDRMLVLEDLGRVLALEPYLGSVVLAGTLLRDLPDAGARALIPAVAAGDCIAAVAYAEPGARHAARWIAASAEEREGQWFLTGEKINVLHGAHADELFVVARISGAPGDCAGLGVFRVAPDAAGLRADGHPLLDRSPAARLVFDRTPALLVGGGTDESGDALLRRVEHAGIAAACAEGVGAMQAALELTISYVSERRQFGQPLGNFQAVKHRLAEMKVATEVTRSAAIAAALAMDASAGHAVPADLHRAKMMLGRHGVFVAQQAIQLHGGIGMTDEYAVGHYLRRITVLDQMFGDAAHHAGRLAAQWAPRAGVAEAA